MNASPHTRTSHNPYPDLPAILETVRAAAAAPKAQRKSFRIHGAGSHDFHGQALEGELLETRGLSGIVQYEPSELVITVAAGTPLCDLEQALAAQGQCLAFEPPVFDADRATSQATVGGMVACLLYTSPSPRD
jgi:glycolate oxidase FAD binding subunit